MVSKKCPLPAGVAWFHPARAFLAGCRRLADRLRSHQAARRTGRAVTEAKVWAGRLEEEGEFLLSLVKGMELEFLTTGGSLDQLVEQLGEIQKLCQELTTLTLGQSQDAAVAFAFHLLKKTEDFVLASYDQYDHVVATFEDLERQLAQLARQRDALTRVLLPLTFVTVSLRIEASRHPPEVQDAFFTLAAGVNRTVEEVRVAMERQFSDFTASERIVRELMARISASIHAHRIEVGATLKSNRLRLQELNASLEGSLNGARDLGQLNEVAGRHISSIVMAQQCHDITRQKIEHVGEAMTEMTAHLRETQTDVPGKAGLSHPYIFQATQIQRRQLQHVFAELDGAAESIKAAILHLQTEAGQAMTAAVNMGSAALDTQVTRQCQDGIGEILGIVRQAVQKISDIIDAFKPLQDSFVDCTANASALANDVRHAGLNAQVLAISAPNGATLEVLAGRVRVISEEVIAEVGRLGDSLSQTELMISNLRLRLEDFQTLGLAEEEILARESALSRQKLAHLEAAIPELIRQIRRQQESFAQSVSKVMANIRFPDTVAEASRRSLRFFQELAAWSQIGDAHLNNEPESGGKIERLQSNYTMQSEREAHTVALAAADPVAGAVPTPGNAELFDNPGPQTNLKAPPEAGNSLPSGPGMVEIPPGTGVPGPDDRGNASPTVLEPAPPAVKSELGDNVELF